MIKVRQNVKLLMLSAFALKINIKSPSKIQTRTQTCKQYTIRIIVTITPKKRANAYVEHTLGNKQPFNLSLSRSWNASSFQSYCAMVDTDPFWKKRFSNSSWKPSLTFIPSLFTSSPNRDGLFLFHFEFRAIKKSTCRSPALFL